MLNPLDDNIELGDSTALESTYSIDPRITRLSYSGRTLLHSCPRKYQLTKISKLLREREQNVTLAFGTVVGIGIQAALENKSWNLVVLDMFLAWDLPDLFETQPKVKKGFFEAIFAVQQFEQVRNATLADYELAHYQDKPAVEFSFRINVLGEFKYRGYVDAVLKHKVTGNVLVLEIKTTGYTEVNEASYGNSSQAIGYSIVLDAVAPGNSSYEVWYLVYKTGAQEFEILPFRKLYSDRAAWIRELVMDCQLIERYEGEDHYPTYGESCMSYNRPCEFYGVCKMSTDSLSLPYSVTTMSDKDEGNYMIELELTDLIDSQLTRGEI